MGVVSLISGSDEFFVRSYLALSMILSENRFPLFGIMLR
jgi:hypothetical protein